jgi:hypothetical protein
MTARDSGSVGNQERHGGPWRAPGSGRGPRRGGRATFAALVAVLGLSATGLIGVSARAQAVACPSGGQYSCADSLDGLVKPDEQTKELISAAQDCLGGICPKDYTLGSKVTFVKAAANTNVSPDQYWVSSNTVYGCSKDGQAATVGGGSVPGTRVKLGSLGALGVFAKAFERGANVLRGALFGLLPLVEAAPPEPPDQTTLQTATIDVEWGHKKMATIKPLFDEVTAQYIVVNLTNDRQTFHIAVPNATFDIAKMAPGDAGQSIQISTTDNVMTVDEGRNECGWA